jgi:hypothetical protein
MSRALARAGVLLVAAATSLVGVTVPGHASPGGTSAAAIATARQATDRYHDVGTATAAGYAEFRDAADIACIDKPGVGTMGIHYVDLANVLDGDVRADDPEAVIYAPAAGRLKLVAVEYIVFQEAWYAHHSDLPRLFGQDFTPVGADNRYGIPPFLELHAWLWQGNPSGMFEDWNPHVSC